MRILMIAHTDAPWTPLYARHLASRGHQVLVASFAPLPLEGVAWSFVGRPPYAPGEAPLGYLAGVPRVRRLARRLRPDVVFAPYIASNGLVAALATRAPLVVSARGGDVLEQPQHRPWRRRVAPSVVRWVCRNAVRIHCVSANLRERLLALGVPAGAIVEFPLGVDLDLFRPGASAAAAGSLVSTRRQVEVSDVATILRALARLRDDGLTVRCTFAGGGSLLDAHRALARDLGLAEWTAFPGQLPRAEVAARLREATVYVSASLSDGASSSLLEAMATGLLPVVPAIEANRSWVQHGRTGLLFAPGDDAALARQLRRALTDTTLRTGAAQPNRERVRREADLRTNLDRLADLLEEVARPST